MGQDQLPSGPNWREMVCLQSDTSETLSVKPAGPSGSEILTVPVQQGLVIGTGWFAICVLPWKGVNKLASSAPGENPVKYNVQGTCKHVKLGTKQPKVTRS